MADIQTYLNNIMKAIYGKDVRQSIHDGIKQCYYDGKAGAIDLEARERAAAAEKRMDTFTSLPSGSTSGNAELIDVRIGLDGTKYSSAGTAVREQIRDTHTIEVTDKEPSKENTQVWINPKEKEEFVLPEVKDYDVNPEDTWSSEKINHKVTELYNEVFYVPEVRNYYNPALQTEETNSPHYYVNGYPYESTQFDSSYHATAMFEIEPNTTYTIGLIPDEYNVSKPWGKATSGAFFYDKDEVYISGTTDKTFTTPINAKYMRFNYSITDRITLERLNWWCVLVKGEEMPSEYIAYVELDSVKNRLALIQSSSSKTIAYSVGTDSIILSTKYTNDKDIQYVLKRKGGNNLFDFNDVYIFNNADPNPIIHDELDSNRFISGGGDWHAPFKLAAVNNIDGDQIDKTHFTGGNHQYNNTGSGSSATASCINLEFIADGLRAYPGDAGYARVIDIIWINNVQGYNTTKADGSGREILREEHRLVFDGREFKSYVELVPLEDVSCELWYGLQIFNSPYNKVRYVDGTNRVLYDFATNSKSGDSETSLMRLYNDDGDRAEIEIDTTFDLGKRDYHYGSDSMFSTTYGKCYCSIINEATTLYADCTYSLRGIYRFYKEVQ